MIPLPLLAVAAPKRISFLRKRKKCFEFVLNVSVLTEDFSNSFLPPVLTFSAPSVQLLGQERMQQPSSSSSSPVLSFICQLSLYFAYLARSGGSLGRGPPAAATTKSTLSNSHPVSSFDQSRVTQNGDVAGRNTRKIETYLHTCSSILRRPRKSFLFRTRFSRQVLFPALPFLVT